MDTPQTVCVFIRSLANGGAEKQSILLAQALQAQFDTYLFVLDKEPLLDKHRRAVEAAGIRLQILEGNLLQKAWTFFRFARRHRVDTIIAHLPSDTFFAGIVGRLAGVRRIYGGLRNAWVARHKLLALRLMHNLVLDGSISNSHAGKAYLDTQGFRAAKTLVMPNGIVIKQQPIDRAAAAAPVRIITVGRFVDQKDYHTAIEVMARLREMDLPVPVHYDLVGYGEREADIRGWIAAHGLDDRVTVHINPPHLPALYEQAHIYLCTSIFEGLSNTVMEAMTYSLPVVATDAGDNRELVAEGETGYILPLKDVEGLAGRLATLIADPQQRQAMGAAGYARIQAGYAFPVFQARYTALVNPSR